MQQYPRAGHSSMSPDPDCPGSSCPPQLHTHGSSQRQVQQPTNAKRMMGACRQQRSTSNNTKKLPIRIQALLRLQQQQGQEPPFPSGRGPHQQALVHAGWSIPVRDHSQRSSTHTQCHGACMCKHAQKGQAHFSGLHFCAPTTWFTVSSAAFKTLPPAVDALHLPQPHISSQAPNNRTANSKHKQLTTASTCCTHTTRAALWCSNLTQPMQLAAV